MADKVTGSQVRVPLEWGGIQQGDRFMMPTGCTHTLTAADRLVTVLVLVRRKLKVDKVTGS
jgi:hypothetical protein